MKPSIAATTIVLALASAHCGETPPAAPRDAAAEAAGDAPGLDASDANDANDASDASGTNDASDASGTSDASDAALVGDCPRSANPCDLDGDGARSTAPGCGGDDCDDRDCRRRVGNAEAADSEGLDEDCNPCTVAVARDGDRDMDGAFDSRWTNRWDPAGRRPACGAGVMVCPDPMNPRCGPGMEPLVRGTDCNDDPAAGGGSADPSRQEACDGIDNDCDGLTDNVVAPGMGTSCTRNAAPVACVDMACGGRPGVRTCTACVLGPCQATGPRCTPGETQPCMLPDRTCVGVRACTASCTPGDACVYPAETCNYRDDNCDGAIDEGLGRPCAQTFQRGGDRALDLTAEWTPLFDATARPADDVVQLLVDGGAVGAAVLRNPIPRAGEINLSGGLLLAATRTPGTIELVEFYLATERPMRSGNEITFPSGTVGYVIQANIRLNTVDIRQLSAPTPPIGSGRLTDDLVNLPVGGIPGDPTPQRNDFQLSLRQGLVSFGMVWPGRPIRVNTGADASGLVALGRPLHLAIVARDPTRDTNAQIVSLSLRRGPAAMGGGPCADTTPPEPYCPR